MRIRDFCLAVSISVAAAATAARAAGPAPGMPPAAGPRLPEPLRRLAGEWQGKARMGDKEVPVTIVYEITAGGSAVLERLFPGTPHEMLSVYALDGDKVVMTHYCALGNHPRMTLKKADGASLAFELVGTDGIRSATDPHMHAMSVAFTDADHIRETWTSFEGGARKDDKLFELTRKR